MDNKTVSNRFALIACLCLALIFVMPTCKAIVMLLVGALVFLGIAWLILSEII